MGGAFVKAPEAEGCIQTTNSSYLAFNKIVVTNTIAGYNSDTYYPKVVKLISKEVIIDKQDIVKNV